MKKIMIALSCLICFVVIDTNSFAQSVKKAKTAKNVKAQKATKAVKSTTPIKAIPTENVVLDPSISKETLIREINELFGSIKQWDYEGIVIDNTGSAKYHICLTPECNPYVSWDFFIKNLSSISLGKFEEYATVDFKCSEVDCIIPTGYQKGGKYEMKKDLQFFIKDAKIGKELVAKLNQLKAMKLN